MARNDSPDREVESWLKTLGIDSLCQWDVLVFLHRHQAALVGADYLAILLGYATEPVVAALDVLESLGLVERSRVSQGARLYQFAPPTEPPRGECFARLVDLAGRRAGRLLLSKQLRRGDSPERLQAAPRLPEEARPVARAAPLRSAEHKKGRKSWRKAI